MTDFLDILRAQLPVDEGYKTKLYTDTMGKLTIGVGRNLTDVGLRHDEIALCLENDITDAEIIARNLAPNFDVLTDDRKAVLVNMAFNLGPNLGEFRDTLRAVKEGRWADAADSMLQSKWARQVGSRAIRLSYEMRGTA